MSKIPIDEAPAGPAMDAAVAEALGYEYERGHLGIYVFSKRKPDETSEEYEARSLFRPSTDIAAAWRLLENLKDERGLLAMLTEWPKDCWSIALFPAPIENNAMAKGISLAICRAFLKANGIEFVEVLE
jgi:hypothetical protein